MKKFIRNRYWFGYWWASICSMHYFYNNNCPMCNAGSWIRESHKKLFGKVGEIESIEISEGFIKIKSK